ncbi:uncharacterized protein TNCV_1523101 [Trichonephila clavipes]|nr:uncharacterized protein TNCV_1523101 [Trichonephila clavipes]
MNTPYAGVKTLRSNTHRVTTNKQQNKDSEDRREAEVTHNHNQKGSQIAELVPVLWPSSSNPVPLKTRRVGQRCTLNLSRAETSSRWCGVVVRRGSASSGVVHVTDHGSKLRGPSPKALV